MCWARASLGQRSAVPTISFSVRRSIGQFNGIAQSAVMIFVWMAGIELDIREAWQRRRETAVTAGLALSVPLLFGCGASVSAFGIERWLDRSQGHTWQFIVGIGMACAVTSLPILILFMEKLEILREPIGQRILRYASLDDIAIWGVLSLILLDWSRVQRQLSFLILFALAAYLVRKLMRVIPARDRWFSRAHLAGRRRLRGRLVGPALHGRRVPFRRGARLRYAGPEASGSIPLLRACLRSCRSTFFQPACAPRWQVGGLVVFGAAAVLLVASVGGKLIGIRIAGKILKWEKGEASIIGWLLQTKALIMIIFVNILLDKHIITSETFTATLLMAVASTMLTVPLASPKLARLTTVIAKGS